MPFIGFELLADELNNGVLKFPIVISTSLVANALGRGETLYAG